MNNLRLLAGLLPVALLSGGVCSYGQSIITLEEIFEAAETNSAQLRPSFTAQTEAEREISVARAGRLPDINASLSLSYIGNGFTTERSFSDYQKAPIPHFGKRIVAECHSASLYRWSPNVCHRACRTEINGGTICDRFSARQYSFPIDRILSRHL